MAIRTIAILSPGEMGSAVGRMLIRSGFEVITCLAGRSERTTRAASESGMRAVGNLKDLVSEADLLLSILVPAQAEAVAASVADALAATGRGTVYADCNAVSPATAVRMAAAIERAGGRFVDAGIIGGPPREGYAPRFYVSGEAAATLAELNGRGIEIVPVGSRPGDASAVKMCYAALTKGTTALQVTLLVAAARLGVYDALVAEFRRSQPDSLRRVEGAIGRLPSVAHRWIGEMEEIASTFEATGAPGGFHRGAAQLFALVSESPLGADRGGVRPALAEAISTLATELERSAAIRPRLQTAPRAAIRADRRT